VSARANLRKYISGVRAGLQSVGIDDQSVLTVIPSQRGSSLGGSVRLGIDPANVDLLAAEAAVGRIARLLRDSPVEALSESKNAIRILSRGRFGTDLPETEWFALRGEWIARHHNRLYELRCIANVLIGDVFQATMDAEVLIEREFNQYSYLKVAVMFFSGESADALGIIASTRDECAEVGLDLPQVMAELQLSILNSDREGAFEVLLRCGSGTAGKRSSDMLTFR
jgi:hypothetical protein